MSFGREEGAPKAILFKLALDISEKGNSIVLLTSTNISQQERNGGPVTYWLHDTLL